MEGLERPQRSLTLGRQRQRVEHVVLVGLSVDERADSTHDAAWKGSALFALWPIVPPAILASAGVNLEADEMPANRRHEVRGRHRHPTRWQGGAMVPTPHRRTVMMLLGGLALLAVSGCGGGATTSTPTKASTTPASSAASQTYSSKAFVLPLTVTVDAALESPPNPDSHNLLSWDSASIDKWVRFLVPVNLYRPGSSVPEAVPKDYLKYLRGQTKDNVEFSDVTKISLR
jgi:hypothetical protein